MQFQLEPAFEQIQQHRVCQSLSVDWALSDCSDCVSLGTYPVGSASHASSVLHSKAQGHVCAVGVSRHRCPGVVIFEFAIELLQARTKRQDVQAPGAWNWIHRRVARRVLAGGDGLRKENRRRQSRDSDRYQASFFQPFRVSPIWFRMIRPALLRSSLVR